MTIEVQELSNSILGGLDQGRTIKLRFFGLGPSKGIGKAGATFISDWTEPFTTPGAVTLEDFAGLGNITGWPGITVGSFSAGGTVTLFFKGPNVSVDTSNRGLSITIFQSIAGVWTIS